MAEDLEFIIQTYSSHDEIIEWKAHIKYKQSLIRNVVNIILACLIKVIAQISVALDTEKVCYPIRATPTAEKDL